MKKLFTIKINKKDNSQVITFNNMLNSKDEVKYFWDLHKTMLDEDLSKILVKKYGKNSVNNLADYDTLKNIVLLMLYVDLKNSNPKVNISSEVHFSTPYSRFASLAKNLVVHGEFDMQIIEDFKLENLRAKLEDFKIKTSKNTLSYPNNNLRSIIKGNKELRDIYKELSAYPVDPDYPDMPLDRGIISAITLLNAIGINTNESCQGHEVCDTVGVVGPKTPYIRIAYDKSIYKRLLGSLESYGKVDNGINIGLTKVHSRESIIISSGNLLAINILERSSRAMYLEKTLNELNEFVEYMYKKSKKQVTK